MTATATMTPLERAQQYVTDLTAAQKRGVTTTAAGQNLAQTLAKYRATVTQLSASPAAPIAGTPGAGTSGGAATPIPAGSPWGQPIDLTKPATDTYTLAEQWYYALQNPGAAPAGSVFSQAGNAGPTLSNGMSTGSYGSFQLGQLLGGIVGAGEQYFPTSVYGTIPTPVLAAGGVSTQVAEAAAQGTVGGTGTASQGTYTPRPEVGSIASGAYGATVAPAGGNASSLVPSPVTTSPVTGQGSGTGTSTAVTDTGTAGGVTSGASGVTGAGGGYDTGMGTPASSGGLSMTDLALIGIGAAGLLFTMHKRKG